MRCQRWSLAFAFLLVLFTGHLTFVATSLSGSAAGAAAADSGTPEHNPDHGPACAIDGPLGLFDRGRLGSFELEAADPGCQRLVADATVKVDFVVQAPPLTSGARRALLQIFLI